MSVPYTLEQAKLDIGTSTDWEDARIPTERKWQQIVDGDEKSYLPDAPCGYCIVKSNLGYTCEDCLAIMVCSGLSDRPPAETLQMLRDLRHEEGEA